LETLEGAFAWLEKLGAEALASNTTGLDHAVLPEGLEDDVTLKDASDKSVGVLPKRIRADRAVASARVTGGSTRRAERPRRAK
jgi:hypothetical protein